MTDFMDMPLRAQSRLMQSGEISATDLVNASLARIERRDAGLRAIVHLAQDAPALAQHWDDMPLQDRPPMAGLILAVKDIIDVEGQPTRCGSHAHPISTVSDAASVSTLRRAGMIPLAKLATYEYALTGPAYDQPNPPARNPWNTDHITGGSSSGSAAAVAGGLVRVALGTDTGGSIRAPAAYCGIVGLKPTWGTVDAAGCVPLSESLDVIGPLAACVEDAAWVMETLVPASAASQNIGHDISGLKVGYARSWFADDPQADPNSVCAMDDAAARLSQLGARIELIDLPPYQPLEDAGTVILQAEALAVHLDALRDRFDTYGTDARRNLLTGAVLTADDVRVARAIAAEFRDTVDRHFAHCAAILTPTTLGPAPAFADFEDGAVWTAMRTLPFNMSGHPAISVPCGFSANGLPLGAQLVGRLNDERTICQIAHAFEQATVFSARPAMGAEPVDVAQA